MKEISLTNSNLKALVDDEDFPLLDRINWHLNKMGYGQNKQFSMHRLILGFPKGNKEIDHINHNKLDNQKLNLRITNKSGYQAGNNKNKSKATTRQFTSSYKGVYLNKKYNIWVAQIQINGKAISIGTFKEERHAAMAYDLWAIEHYGQFAKTNLNVIAHSLK